jgi:hypothetical protein
VNIGAYTEHSTHPDLRCPGSGTGSTSCRRGSLLSLEGLDFLTGLSSSSSFRGSCLGVDKPNNRRMDIIEWDVSSLEKMSSIVGRANRLDLVDLET